MIENVVSFVSGDVGNSPGFKEPEESMSTSPQASIIAMEQQQLRAEVSFNLKSFLIHHIFEFYGFLKTLSKFCLRVFFLFVFKIS